MCPIFIFELQATDEELKKFVSLYDNIEKVPTTGCDLEGTFLHGCASKVLLVINSKVMNWKYKGGHETIQ